MEPVMTRWSGVPGMNEAGELYDSYTPARGGRPAVARTLAGKVELVFAPDPQTALFLDRRVGLSFGLPGRPQLLDTDHTVRPRRDAAVRLRDLPLELDERLDRDGEDPSAALRAYSAGRAVEPKLLAIAPERLAWWGAQAGVEAVYPLITPPGRLGVEATTVLHRRDCGLVTLAIRCDRRAVGPIVWSAVKAAIFGSLVWDPGRVQRAVPRLWPDSVWLAPCVPPRLLPEATRLGDELRALYAGEPAPGYLRARLLLVATSAEPPANPVWTEALRRDLVAHARGEAEIALWERALAKVADAHDLRGFALAALTGLTTTDFAKDG